MGDTSAWQTRSGEGGDYIFKLRKCIRSDTGDEGGPHRSHAEMLGAHCSVAETTSVKEWRRAKHLHLTLMRGRQGKGKKEGRKGEARTDTASNPIAGTDTHF